MDNFWPMISDVILIHVYVKLFILRMFNQYNRTCILSDNRKYELRQTSPNGTSS